MTADTPLCPTEAGLCPVALPHIALVLCQQLPESGVPTSASAGADGGTTTCSDHGERQGLCQQVNPRASASSLSPTPTHRFPPPQAAMRQPVPVCRGP